MISKFIGEVGLKLIGWDLKFSENFNFNIPYVYCMYPHTAFSDIYPPFFFGLKQNINFFIIVKRYTKLSIIDNILKSINLLQIDRSAAAYKTIKEHSNKINGSVCISIDGTREKKDSIKSGFHYISKEIDMKLVVGLEDYHPKSGKKIVYLSDPFIGGNTPEETLEIVKNVINDMCTENNLDLNKLGRYPEKASPLKFKEKEHEVR